MEEENNQPKEFEQPEEDYWNPAERFGIDANGNEQIRTHDFITGGTTIFIEGSPVTDKQDIDYLLNIFSGRDMNNILEAAISQPETGHVQGSHQHMAVLLKENKRIKAPEALTLPSGKKIMLFTNQMTLYSQETKDITKLIEYMEKNDKPCIYHYTAPDADKVKRGKRIPWSQAIKNALEMGDMRLAESYLLDHSADKFLTTRKNFESQYLKKHEREIQMRATYKPDLLPFKELEETKQIMDWVKLASANNRKRNGVLFIVGPTKTGKTEFIIQNVYRKYNSFLMRGNYMWDKFDSNQKDLKFLIFDDVHPEMQMVKDIKALTSTKKIPTQMNIKYGFAVVKSCPCIILMNENNYNNYWKLVSYAKETDWYKRNSFIVKIEELLYPLKSELRKMEIEKRKELRNNNQEDMSEHSIEFDDKSDETQEENNDSEQEEIENNPNNEKKPKEKIPYEKKTKHSFRSRVKHLLKRMNKDDDQIEQFLDEMDEIGLEDLEDKEAIEYGFNDEDDIDNNQSLVEEIEGEKARKQLANIKNKPKIIEMPDDETNEEVEDYDELPPSTIGYSTQSRSSLLGYDPDVTYD